MKTTNENTWEDSVRKRCMETGFTLHKGKGPINKNNKGHYKIVSVANPDYTYGHNYDRTLDEVEEILDELTEPKTLKDMLVEDLVFTGRIENYPEELIGLILDELDGLDESSDFFLLVESWIGPIDEEAEYHPEGLNSVVYGLLGACDVHGVPDGFTAYMESCHRFREEVESGKFREELEQFFQQIRERGKKGPAFNQALEDGFNRSPN